MNVNYSNFSAGYNSYSRSYRGAIAESNGKLPLTRAAKELGVSVKAFRAGIERAGLGPAEWHHVGKYAVPVDYYDTEELRESPLFWLGCYKTYKKKADKVACRSQAVSRR